MFRDRGNGSMRSSPLGRCNAGENKTPMASPWKAYFSFKNNGEGRVMRAQSQKRLPNSWENSSRIPEL